MKVLVDTSVWSLALRRKPQDLSPAEQRIVTELSELVRSGRASILGLIRQELLSGVKTAGQFERLRMALVPFRDEPIDTIDHESAAKTSNDCRREGIAVSVVDILICAVAQRRGIPIFSTDPDFERYAKALSLKLHSMSTRTE